MDTGSHNIHYSRRLVQLIAAASTLLASVSVLALPQGGTTLPDGTTIAETATSLEINQTAERTVIRWNTYNLQNGESVIYNMSDSAAVLNIIDPGSVSNIDGLIGANGAVYLINPRGIVFGPNALVNVGSLVASTLSADSDEFLAGGSLQLNATDIKGAIINNGLITAATGGNVALLGNTVINQGQIQARGSAVNLAAGEAMVLDFDSNGFIQIEVTEEVSENIDGFNDAIRNSGNVIATNVTMEAHVAADIFTNAVNHSGVIRAQQFGYEDGGIVRLTGYGGNVVVDLNATTVAASYERNEVFPEPEGDGDTDSDSGDNDSGDNDSGDTGDTGSGDTGSGGEGSESNSGEGSTGGENTGTDSSPTNPGANSNTGGTDGTGSESGNNDPELDSLAFQRALANSEDPTSNGSRKSTSSNSLGLFNIESPGVRLPADQLEEEL